MGNENFERVKKLFGGGSPDPPREPANPQFEAAKKYIDTGPYSFVSKTNILSVPQNDDIVIIKPIEIPKRNYNMRNPPDDVNNSEPDETARKLSFERAKKFLETTYQPEPQSDLPNISPIDSITEASPNSTALAETVEIKNTQESALPVNDKLTAPVETPLENESGLQKKPENKLADDEIKAAKDKKQNSDLNDTFTLRNIAKVIRYNNNFFVQDGDLFIYNIKEGRFIRLYKITNQTSKKQ